MKIITSSMVEKYLTTKICLEAVRNAMTAVSREKTHLPIRQFIPIMGREGKMALMPGAMNDPDCFGIKLVCKYPRAEGSKYGTHVGMVLVFDSKLGIPLAMIEGASLTAIRTAAASALATDLLANRNCSTLTIMGNGEQAKRHIRAMLAVRNPSTILIWGRDQDKTKFFASSMARETNCSVHALRHAEEAVSRADLICTTTSSSEPILLGAWLKPGTHINLVGAATASSAEADQEVVKRSRFFVDYRPAAMAAAGELLRAIEGGAIDKDHISAEIGEVVQNPNCGRQNDGEITVYKSLGLAAQDLAVGHLLYKLSIDQNFGFKVDMMDYAEMSL
ncbi:ornithine cyclodeaminase family protein [Sphingorhabdus sp. EL138]|uniref:ornithine cyclodeaminase family protein n=1 Tax=Sphingorhabdus sp. EL138 TaxID=2073156 RepID=UPI000D69AEA3|nr:ornithine cyclodeaminase family protein [Sphingorhabdus sp. EL138]